MTCTHWSDVRLILLVLAKGLVLVHLFGLLLTNEKFPEKVSFRETQESDKFFLEINCFKVSVSKEMVKKT